MRAQTIIKLKTKGSLKNIIHNKFDGIYREYLISDSDEIFNIAYKISRHFKGDIYLEVKYPFGFREKRIEILLKDGKIYYLIKIVRDITKVDQEALLLDQLISKIEKDMHLLVRGVVILRGKISSDVIKNINNDLKNRISFITEYSIENQSKKIKLEDLENGIFS